VDLLYDKLYNKIQQQIEILQQIHNISPCRDVVQQMDTHNKSTTKLQQIE